MKETLDRLRGFSGDGSPVVSVYLNVGADRGEQRAVPVRLKDLLQPVRDEAAGLGRDVEKAVRCDAELILGLASRIGSARGRGVGVFACEAAGLMEVVELPAAVRDRAVLGDEPYLWPAEAMLAELRRTCAVVVDRRRAEIHRFYLDELETWEQLDTEELRKANFGGFAGYEERRVRTHAAEVTHRHFRDVAARLAELQRAGGFDLLVLGGQAENVDQLVDELPGPLRDVLAGTFTVDTHTVTPAVVLDHCRALVAQREAREHSELADHVIDLAKGGGLAALGLERVLAAVNQRAVELLVVAADTAIPGMRCIGCGWLTASVTAACQACGEVSRPVPDLVDAMAGAVRSAGGAARHLLSETPLGAHRVGATLRFAVPAP